MPTAYTPGLNLSLPEVGASRDTWGTLLNDNFTALDEFVYSAMPIGSVIDFAGPNAPSGWLICDGRTLSRTTYSALFAAIGTHWGAGDGSTTFALPNTPGRASVGPGTVTDSNGTTKAYAYAQVIGTVSVSITQANLPGYNLVSDTRGNHNHTGPVTAAGSHAHSTDAQGTHSHGGATAGQNVDHSHTGYTDAQGAHLHNISLPNQGSGAQGGPYSVMSNVFGNGNYQTDVQGAHSHNVQTYGASTSHLHGIGADGNHAHNVNAVGDHVHYIQWEGDHAHNIWSGGSNARLDVQPPVVVMTKIIYAGPQAMTAVAMQEAPLRRRVMASPMRGRH